MTEHSVFLPPLPARLTRRDYTVLRGSADAAALRFSHHDASIHQGLRPADFDAAGVFDVLEQVRTEAIGAQQMAGLAANIFVMLEERFKQPRFSGASRHDVSLEEAVGIMARHHIMGSPFTRLSPDFYALWKPFLETILEPFMTRLSPLIHDQKAFAEIALTIALLTKGQRVRVRVPCADSGDESSEPEAEQEPGPIAGGDRSQGPAEGAKSFEQEAIGDEPIYGDADMADRPRQDAFAEQATADYDEVSEPSRRVVSDTEGDPNEYKIFTTEFDEILSADKIATTKELKEHRRTIDQELSALKLLLGKLANRLQRTLLSAQPRVWQRDLEEDILDQSRLARLIVDPLSGSIYKKNSEEEVHDTVVTLLLDNSGSMRGHSSMVVALCVDVLARCLERCGVKLEVLGFTTKTWRGGRAREKWLSQGSPRAPGRLNEVRHVIYKFADTGWRASKQNIGLLLVPGFHKENIDGEAVAWAHHRLLSRPEKRKILVVISDGAPVDDATLAAAQGTGNYLERHLRQVIEVMNRYGSIELVAIGIGYEVGRLYPNAIMIKDVDDLGPVLINQLSGMLETSHKGYRQFPRNPKRSPIMEKETRK